MPKSTPEPDTSDSSDSITKKPIFQKILWTLILLAIIAGVIYLMHKSGSLQKLPVISKLFK